MQLPVWEYGAHTRKVVTRTDNEVKRKERYKQAEMRVGRRVPSLEVNSLETEVSQPLTLDRR